jgi:hypothetical protein
MSHHETQHIKSTFFKENMKEIYPNQVKSNQQLMALRYIERKDKKRYIIMTKNKTSTSRGIRL